jgi:hypothetical protein
MELLCILDKQHGCFQSIPDCAIHIKEIPSMKTIMVLEYSEVVTFIRYTRRGKLYVNNHIIRLNQGDRTPMPLKWYQFHFCNKMRPVRLQVYVRSMKALRADCTILGRVWQNGSYKIRGQLNPRDVIVTVRNDSKCFYKNYSGGQDGLFKSIFQSIEVSPIRDDYCYRHHNYREYEFFSMDETYKECEECGTNTIENFSADGLGPLISCSRQSGSSIFTRTDILIFKFSRGFVVYSTRSGNGIQTTEAPFVFRNEILINNVWTPLSI